MRRSATVESLSTDDAAATPGVVPPTVNDADMQLSGVVTNGTFAMFLCAVVCVRDNVVGVHVPSIEFLFLVRLSVTNSVPSISWQEIGTSSKKGAYYGATKVDFVAVETAVGSGQWQAKFVATGPNAAVICNWASQSSDLFRVGYTP